MKISELIIVLTQELKKHGDIEVHSDQDYGEHIIEECFDPLYPFPSYREATGNMPERIVL